MDPDKTLTTAADGLPEAASAAYSSDIYEAPFEFNYLRFHVKKTHTGKVNFQWRNFVFTMWNTIFMIRKLPKNK